MAAGELNNDDGHETREAKKLLADFVIEHASTITNALVNHHRRMVEAAALAQKEGWLAYTRTFNEDAGKTEQVHTGLHELLERLSEGGQEDFASQG